MASFPFLAEPPKFLAAPGVPVMPWEQWCDVFQVYMTASGADEFPDERKRALLLNCLGCEGQQLFKNLRDTGFTFKSAMVALEAHFSPQVNVVYVRFVFRLRHQLPNETTDEYAKVLRQLACKCRFGVMMEEMVRDQIVEKTRMSGLRERLLIEPDLTLEKTLQLAARFEAAAHQEAVLESMKEVHRSTILLQLPHLLQVVQLTPEFTSQLLRLRVFTPDGLKELETEPVMRERCHRLLLEVMYRGPHAFDGLVRALLESGQLAAARLLRPTLSLAGLMEAAARPAAASPPAGAGPHSVVPTTAPHRLPAEHQLPAGGDMDAPGPQLQLRPALRASCTVVDSYPMMSRPRGLALVISNIRFPDTNLSEREGGKVDEVALPSLLKRLGFEVQLERDLNRSGLLGAITTFAKNKAHARYHMAVLAVLTHGCEHALYGVDSRKLLVEQVIGSFSHEAAPHLAGKPKWLVFQACRGNERNCAWEMEANRQTTDGYGVPPSPPPPQRMASFGDIYLTFSTTPGYVSLRDLDRGTWLVKVLCEVFSEFAHDHTLHELHMIVHDRMQHMSFVSEKQIIETAQRGWCKKLYFNPGL